MARVKLHVLDLGRLRVPGSLLTGSAPSPFGERVEIPVSAYSIEHPDGRVLFDAGCHPQAMGPNGRWPLEAQRDYGHLGGEECTLPHRLEQLGLGPDDFRYVVLSHLHSDHAGCVEFFRKSQLIVHAAELQAAVEAHKAHDDRAYAWKDTDAWIGAPLDWRRIDAGEGDLDLHDEVRLHNFGSGHAFGMLGLSVRLAEIGQVMLVSDAVYCAENLQGVALPGWMHDEPGYRNTLDRIRVMANAGADVWYGHDPRQFASLRKSTDGWYE